MKELRISHLLPRLPNCIILSSSATMNDCSLSQKLRIWLLFLLCYCPKCSGTLCGTSSNAITTPVKAPHLHQSYCPKRPDFTGKSSQLNPWTAVLHQSCQGYCLRRLETSAYGLQIMQIQNGASPHLGSQNRTGLLSIILNILTSY